MIENSRIISLKDASRFVIDAISDGDWRERIDNLPALKDVELISEEEIEKFLLRIEDEPEAKATTEDQRLAWCLAESLIKQKVNDDWEIVDRLSRVNSMQSVA